MADPEVQITSTAPGDEGDVEMGGGQAEVVEVVEDAGAPGPTGDDEEAGEGEEAGEPAARLSFVE